MKTIGLLGGMYTKERDFYRGRLEQLGLSVAVPDAASRETINRVIFDELVRGTINPGSRSEYLRIIQRLIDDGAEGIIAGCTEIELLVGPDEVGVPYFPTTRIHALAAVDLALEP